MYGFNDINQLISNQIRQHNDLSYTSNNPIINYLINMLKSDDVTRSLIQTTNFIIMNIVIRYKTLKKIIRFGKWDR